jgi:mannose-1-phosphate guanylyltransferase
MKAIILAAGKGTRVRPITNTLPKPMIPILNKPVMELLVDLLALHEVRKIMVNTSYLPTAIENYFRDGARFGVEMAYSFEGRLENGHLLDEPVGSAGAIRRIQDHSGFFDETFVVLCGDAVIDLDLTALLRFHREKRAAVTIALAEVPRDQVPNYGVVVMDEDSRITEFQEKPALGSARSTTANTGIYIFEPEVIDHIPSGVAYDIGGELFPTLVAKGCALYGATLPFQWLDIGKLSDYHRVAGMALRGEVHRVPIPGTQIAEGIWVGLNVSLDLQQSKIVPPVCIGGSVTIEPGSSIIGPAMIGSGCVIESGAYIENSLIFDYTRVGSSAHVKNTMVSGGYSVDAAGTVVDIAQSDIDWVITDSRSAKKSLTHEQEQLLQMLQEW